jgi:hypothetical protein
VACAAAANCGKVNWVKAVAVHSSEVRPRKQQIGLRSIIEGCGFGGVMRVSEYYKPRLNVDRVDPGRTAQRPFGSSIEERDEIIG